MILKNLIIHTCCADCLLNAFFYIKKSRGVIDKRNEITLFYNPNIHPRSEYLERLNAVKKNISRTKRRRVEYQTSYSQLLTKEYLRIFKMMPSRIDVQSVELKIREIYSTMPRRRRLRM